ncbi:hypothetical protein L7F22_039716 [Adiantum nelumboides]|nr:hypothetical protein [Adiantum nelumboides]
MVAATRSRSSPSHARALLPRHAKSVKAEHVRTPVTRAATAASVKEEKDYDCSGKRGTPPALFTRNSSIKSDIPVKRESSAAEELGDGRKQQNMEKTPSSLSTAASDYESARLQRIAENKARLAALGVEKQAESLTSFFQASKPSKRPWKKAPITPFELRRRSERLKNTSPAPGFYSPFSDPFVDEFDRSPKLVRVLRARVYRNYSDEESPRPGNAPLPKNCPTDLQVSPILSALRCRSKERGTLYDSIVGICCHFCRQKKLCGEEDCERCGQRDVTKACLGKTDCSKCHSSTGVFCRACLKIRYGEDIEQVRQRNDWLCPHCTEEEGVNPYWICNSSICLSRRKMAPTGIAIYKARELGYKSVAHYLADVLEKQELK